MTFDIYKGHHYNKLASEILLTKFGNPDAYIATIDF